MVLSCKHHWKLSIKMKKTILVTDGTSVNEFSIIQYFYQKNYNIIIYG